ncbi:sn-glycerol-3-phosphate ABC transporter ATP-binding protein UgpC [Yinghuangia sp. ASG 101]|uniref:ABC transporter ATP-binding protein n=1 Tax=Yinghuangia sp. ASG 101 TaxID=2896848 RepID=UPI001E59967F|nr:sn-glycerol-3-phosphate ABC transporter ATP-binding protein UgpC [Yinghuangia sp. ASG 101]UGQ14087.1 sn-glycerol-3-phosphate ABC transporter ATP-binding protein UgpC [Yinghuangia sp. ASG 101]
MADVVLDGVGKVYTDGTRAVDALDLSVAHGEFLVLVGPSGCGKTTALRMVAGLEDISEGTVRIGDRVVNRVPSRDRDVAMVFQSYALYPHLNVRDNIGFGLRLRKLPKAEIRDRVAEAARTLGLEEHLLRKPRQLSGGQRQRVAMGRAIVREPQAFLMDEPLSNLDAKLRVQMRAQIARLTRELGVTTLYVTHDQVEAMTLGDRVAVMRKGVLQQVAPPQELYDRPVNLFVAGFIGSPAMNLLSGRLEAAGPGLAVRLGEQRLTVPDRLAAERPALRAYTDKPVIVGIRPEDLHDAADDTGEPPEGTLLRAEADLVESMGSEVHVHVRLAVPPAVTADVHELAADAGADETPDPGADTSELVARLGPRTSVTDGDTARLRVATDRMHFFDPATGLSIREES